MQSHCVLPLFAYLICLEGISQFLNDGLIGWCVRGGVKHKYRVEDEGISVVLLVTDALWAAHNAVPRHIPKEKDNMFMKPCYMCVHHCLLLQYKHDHDSMHTHACTHTHAHTHARTHAHTHTHTVCVHIEIGEVLTLKSAYCRAWAWWWSVRALHQMPPSKESPQAPGESQNSLC